MSSHGDIFMDDFKVLPGVDFFGGENAIFAVDFEDDDRDHQVARELEGVGVCEGKVVRHVRGSIQGAGQFPLDGSSKGWVTGAITARRSRSGRSLLDPMGRAAP